LKTIYQNDRIMGMSSVDLLARLSDHMFYLWNFWTDLYKIWYWTQPPIQWVPGVLSRG